MAGTREVRVAGLPQGGVMGNADRPRVGSRLRRWAAGGVVALGLLPLSGAVNAPVASAANSFCAELGHGMNASAGGHMYCDYLATARPIAPRAKAASPQAQVPAEHNSQNPPQSSNNVNSANPQEDQTSATLQSYGQSETSIAGM